MVVCSLLRTVKNVCDASVVYERLMNSCRPRMTVERPADKQWFHKCERDHQAARSSTMCQPLLAVLTNDGHGSLRLVCACSSITQNADRGSEARR
jgi:hypothetical protein